MHVNTVPQFLATIAALIHLLAPLTYAQPVLFVDDDAPPSGDGLTWETAYSDLQDALTTARQSEGVFDEIRVAQGIYRPAGPNGDRTISFELINGVALRGGYAGPGQPNPDQRNIDLYETTLSGDLNDDDGPDFENNEENSFHVTVSNQIDRTAVLDGFTVTCGNAYESYPDPFGYGAGMFNENASPTVTGCLFTRNRAEWGAGMWNENKSSPSVSNSTFTRNEGVDGGAMGNENSNPLVTNCTFFRNAAQVGAGIFNTCASAPRVTRCTFSENAATLAGGALYASTGNAPLLFQSTLNNNFAPRGGAVYTWGGTPVLINCIVNNNSAETGGALYCTQGSAPKLVHCTLAGNSAIEGDSIACRSSYPVNPSTVAIANCVLWSGAEQIWNSDQSSILVKYCNVRGGWPGEGNIDADPRFADPGKHDYRLLAGSPCIDAADDDAVPPQVTRDADGNPRFRNDPDTPETGNGNCVIVDMGAYEFPGLLRGDLNEDEDVDLFDFDLLQDCFTGPFGGPVGPECECSDLDHDLDVDLIDWGVFQAEFTGEGDP